MDIWAIYYIDPVTQERFICTSSGHMIFMREDNEETVPAIFVSEFRAIDALRKYVKTIVQQKWPHYGSIGADGANGRGGKTVPDLVMDDFVVVPVTVVPDFSRASRRVLTDKFLKSYGVTRDGQ
jgi:hypothetical protein